MMANTTVVSDAKLRIDRPEVSAGISGLILKCAQAVCGLLVPLLVLWAVRPILRGRWGGGARTFVILFFPAMWLFVLALQFSIFAFLGFPPFQERPKLYPLTWQVVIGVNIRGLVGAFQL